MMSMSKKDFDLLADSLADQQYQYRDNEAVREAIVRVKNELRYTLQAEYGERFNDKKFLKRYQETYALLVLEGRKS